MIPFTVAEITAAVGGTLHADDAAVAAAVVDGPVEYDSRKVAPGGLFVAFAGAKVDAHDFAAKAVADGAVAVLGSRPVDGVPTIVVEDPRAALGLLARAVLARLDGLTVVAITGSSGKTSTKDLIAALLRTAGPTVATTGSENNELGTPYTVLKVTAGTRYLVLEMGARGVGHLRYLCDIAPPDVSVVVNVGTSHIAEFGSLEGTTQAKGELVEALRPSGLAVLNADDPRVAGMAGRTAATVVLAGESGTAAVRATDVRDLGRGRFGFTLHLPGADPVEVRLDVAGRHQVGNALLAAAVASHAGVDPTSVAAVLGDLEGLSTRRMDVFDRADDVTVIDDSYNANPASMAAALRALAAVAGGRRMIAVLGYMAELGEYERTGHEEVGRLAAELGVDRLVAVGEQAAPILHGASVVASWGGDPVLVTDQEAAVALLRDELRPRDVVLVKGSRYRTWDIADALRAEAAAK
ncbi:UDP-N-acetylmuramoyl-tripeptide--D-alanyl-D-alanine ligase [Dactylosporangium aurantiacum]|uniref:UDP-N-acetylmuramoyl-tripeptide--D-alanyl-D-alanine ligase n=1 Tax=Dactylosporangium aurantiacum TaxID=35754 RepID=A0A9Q9MG01_9ACTN|nr:UDP-N-acetylmuramoyl-tripeptide--D-alanyl-D-alanine ligase [Dactylosporangium aurantiacum]MDG6102526.1 UDP-N-acetylmuramoyl-tripeptide--D-alanyl-D-alanine ligase [Dactylosporangium aurantiacum]UWZ53200.1 UDP-N-acetylmuramoyl-tripeptide--D-alanyl-D-alanine ligase [Dactylosporangium aurantiacum]